MADLCQQSAALRICIALENFKIHHWQFNHGQALAEAIFATSFLLSNIELEKQKRHCQLAAAKLSGVVKWLLQILSSRPRHQPLTSLLRSRPIRGGNNRVYRYCCSFRDHSYFYEPLGRLCTFAFLAQKRKKEFVVLIKSQPTTLAATNHSKHFLLDVLAISSRGQHLSQIFAVEGC